VNAVYFNKIQERPEAERAAYVQQLRDEYRADVDLQKLASELVVDDIVPGESLRTELQRRYDLYEARNVPGSRKKHCVYPV
jgi:acetyl-CoA carboxylase carboxyltransferase component